MTVLPVAVVVSGYMVKDPAKLADRIIHRLGLTGSTATLIHDILTCGAGNKFGATLIAVASAALFHPFVSRDALPTEGTSRFDIRR